MQTKLYTGLTSPQRRKLRGRKDRKSIGGKSPRIIPLGAFLSGSSEQRELGFRGQKITAQVKGPIDIKGFGLMFGVFHSSLPIIDYLPELGGFICVPYHEFQTMLGIATKKKVRFDDGEDDEASTDSTFQTQVNPAMTDKGM
jgi:hypothetical protein